MFDIYPAGSDLWIFHWLTFRILGFFVNWVLCCWLMMCWKQFYIFGHFLLYPKIIACISLLWIAIYYYIIISIACLSWTDVSNDSRISFLWPNLSLMHVGYFCVRFQWVNMVSKHQACYIGRYRNLFFPSIPFCAFFCLVDLLFIFFP